MPKPCHALNVPIKNQFSNHDFVWFIGTIFLLKTLGFFGIIFDHQYHINTWLVIFLGHIDQHKTGVDGHHHFLFDFSQIFRQRINWSIDATGHRYGIFGITHAILQKKATKLFFMWQKFFWILVLLLKWKKCVMRNIQK